MELKTNLKLKDSARIVQALTKLMNDNMKTIQLETEIVQRKFEINYGEINQDKFRINEMEQELTNNIRNISIENNGIS